MSQIKLYTINLQMKTVVESLKTIIKSYTRL